MRTPLFRPLLLALQGVVVLVLGGGLLTAYQHSPQRATVFAPGYDEVAFGTLTPGTSAREVRDLLGEPLSRGEADGREYWFYSGAAATPGHMVRRTVVIDAHTKRVASLDTSVRFDYVAHLFPRRSGG